MPYDVVIVGGGPSGHAGALALGRARKRVLLCDSGPRRNANAVHLHNFLTRDGTPPDELRKIARAELATYPNVEFRDALVTWMESGHVPMFQESATNVARNAMAPVSLSVNASVISPRPRSVRTTESTLTARIDAIEPRLIGCLYAMTARVSA